MASYMHLVEDCDRLPDYPDSSYKFLIQGCDGVYGHLTESTFESLFSSAPDDDASAWTRHWKIDPDKKTLTLLGGNSAASRTGALEETMLAARAKRAFKALDTWSGERCAIHGPGREPVAAIERRAAPLLGLPTYGVGLIAYSISEEEEEEENDGGGLRIWLQRRSARKFLYPGWLGVTVGGGVSAGELPSDCLAREAAEEAGFPRGATRLRARAAGTIAYVTVTDEVSTPGGTPGLVRPEIQYAYEVEVRPGDVLTPRVVDRDEVEGYVLWPVREVKEVLRRKGPERIFTPANAAMLLDFLIRHGEVTYESEVDYNQIMSRLHRPLGVVTA